MCFLRLLFLLSLCATIGSGRSYGTLNGYDREGGSDPICWLRELNTTSIDVNNYSVDFLRDLRDTLLTADADMLDECYQGLTMNVTLQADVSYPRKAIIGRGDSPS